MRKFRYQYNLLDKVLLAIVLKILVLVLAIQLSFQGCFSNKI